MPKIEQNAEGFKYIITYRNLDIEDAQEESMPVDLPEAWHQVTPFHWRHARGLSLVDAPCTIRSYTLSVSCFGNHGIDALVHAVFSPPRRSLR